MNQREWIHVDDHCEALIRYLKRVKLGKVITLDPVI